MKYQSGICMLGFNLFVVSTIIQCHPDYPHLKFHQSRQTLQHITRIINQKRKGVYLRFGDGDINLAMGCADMMQQPNVVLQREMQEAFGITGNNVLKGLPLHSAEFGGLEQGMFPGNHETPYELNIQMLHNVRHVWAEEIEDVYTNVALAFCSTHHQKACVEFLQCLKKGHCILVGNQNIPKKIRTLLFGSKCVFIPTPERNSYNEIDRIESDCLQAIKKQKNDYTIIITSMGCSGRILQKRLWYKLDHLFLFDFGSLMDALCGWNTRAWIELTHFDHAAFLELLAREL